MCFSDESGWRGKVFCAGFYEEACVHPTGSEMKPLDAGYEWFIDSYLPGAGCLGAQPANITASKCWVQMSPWDQQGRENTGVWKGNVDFIVNF